MWKIKSKEENRLVVKHNKLIEFKGRMTLNELKLFSLIVADIREQQEKQFEEYKIDISVLKEITKDKNFYDYIKEVALKLESKRIVVEGSNEKKKRYFTTIRLINKPRYEEGEYHLVVDLDKDLIPYIIDLKRNFTRYEIENILRLKSTYSVRLYELLKQYQSIGNRKINIDDLRDYLGIEKDEYDRFYDFERRVLKVAKKEIDKYTDLEVDYEKIKTGRKITGIKFTIDSKPDVQKELIESIYTKEQIKDIKTKCGLKSERFNSKQIIELYEIAVAKTESADIDVHEYIKLNYNDMIEKGTARNKFSYLKKALEEDYAKAVVQLSLGYVV